MGTPSDTPAKKTSTPPRPGSTIPRPKTSIPLPSGKGGAAATKTTPLPAKAIAKPVTTPIPAAPRVPVIEAAEAPASTTIVEAKTPACESTAVEVAPPVAATERKRLESAPTEVATSPMTAKPEPPVVVVAQPDTTPEPQPVIATPATAPLAFPAPLTFAPVTLAVQQNPFQATPSHEDRSPFATVADEVEIDVAPEIATAIATEKPAADPMRLPMVSIPDPSPSKEALLERAAALGPVRMTWASFVPTSDPILEAKMKPQIAERRARFQKIVKGTLAGCAALCFIAVVVTLVSGGESTARAASASELKNAPARSIVTVEKMASAKRSKAAPHAPPAVTTAAFVRPKRR